MSEDQRSVSYWIRQLKAGDEEAMWVLWNRYYQQLRDFAEENLAEDRTSVADQGDVAASSLEALWQGARAGRFRKLDNRQDLWHLLVAIASRKVANTHRGQPQQDEQRGPANAGTEDSAASLAEQIHMADFDVPVADLSVSCDQLLVQLDDKHRQVALMRLAGFTNHEIADKRDCSVKSVERYMKMIRAIWYRYLDL